jgi:hypothetical protein
MDAWWPWLGVSGAGALHGLNPCTGWALAAACGWRARQARPTLHALGPIALGHAASVGAVAAAVALGLAMDGLWRLAAVAVLAAALLAWRWRLRAGGLGVALASFVASTVHGSGLMLVPAFVPLCLSASPAREITASGSLALALAAVTVHMAAMLAVTAVVALGVGRCGRAVRTKWTHRFFAATDDRAAAAPPDR